MLKSFLKIFAIFTGKHLCWCLFFNYQKRDSSTGVSCEYCEIFKETYFEEHLATAASVIERVDLQPF